MCSTLYQQVVIHEQVCTSHKSKVYCTQDYKSITLSEQIQKKRLVFKPQCSLSHNSVTTICKQMVWNRHDVRLCVTTSYCTALHIASCTTHCIMHYTLHHALLQTDILQKVQYCLALGCLAIIV